MIMRLIAFILTLLLALSPALSHAASNDDLFPPKVVVKGDNFTLTDREIEQAFIQFKQTSAARGQEIPPAQEPALMLSIREKLIAEKILFLSANEEDRKNGREAVDKYLKTVKDNSGSDESYKRQLKSLGMPAEEFERRMFEKAVGDMVLKREIKDKIKITDEQVKDYYQKNSDAFKSPVEITAAHILITTIDLKTRRPFPQEERLKRKAVARRLMERARSGEDFTKLVKEFSDDPGSKDRAVSTPSVSARWFPSSRRPRCRWNPARSVTWSRPPMATTSSN